MKKMIMLIGAVVIGVVGCAGPKVAMNPGATRLIERTPNTKPNWVDTGVSYRAEKDTLQFIGTVKDRGDFALSIREGAIEATKIAVEQLARELNTTLRQSAVGANVGDDLGRHIEDLFLQESRNVKLSGLVQREYSVEKWQEGTVSGARNFYNASVLMEIPKADYLAAKEDLLDRATGRAREARNAKAEEVLNQFRSEVKGERAAAVRQP